ncbi:MAG: hypothetical protein JW843_10190, partial [Candidatus Aminicenantes bacterium]|nr:hypothetical protein [Candidatus Aminicenantes bacterium]
MRKKISIGFGILLAVLTALPALAAAPAGAIDGLWVAVVRPDVLRLRLTAFHDEDEGEWSTSLTVRRKDWPAFENGKEFVHAWKKDAGTATFKGKFEGDRGSGTFSFVPDPGFAQFLAGRRIGRVDDEKLVFLFLGDIDKKYIEEMEKLGFSDFSSSRLVELAIHRVTADYVRDLQSLGWRSLSLSKVLEFKIHGITKAYVQDLKNQGFDDLSPQSVLELKIHGLTREYIEGIKAAG